MRVVEPVPKEGGKDDFYGRKAHLFIFCQDTRVTQDDFIGIYVQDAGVNVGKALPESFLKHLRDFSSLFWKVKAVIALAPGFSVARRSKSCADAVPIDRFFGEIVVKVFAVLVCWVGAQNKCQYQYSGRDVTIQTDTRTNNNSIILETREKNRNDA